MYSALATLLFSCCMPIPKPAIPDQYAPGYFGVRMTPEGRLVRITEVVEDTPASRAGIQPGDLLQKIGTYQVDGDDELREMITTLRPGTRLPIVVTRKGKNLTLLLTVTSKN